MSKKEHNTFNRLADLLDHLEKIYGNVEEEYEQDESPTECYEPEPQQNDQDECDCVYEDLTAIEALILKQITNHNNNGTFPSLAEAQAIAILDEVNRKYNTEGE